MDDEKILDLFFQRSEAAIQQLNLKYGKLCHRLSYQILNNRQDAEECVNDAYLGTWNAIPPARPNPLAAYLCRIVRNLSLKRYRQNTAAKRNSIYDVALTELEGCLTSSSSPENTLEAHELTGILESFFDMQTAENRVIFLSRYWFCDSYADIAARTGLTEKIISVRLTRLRRRLKHYLMERGVIV